MFKLISSFLILVIITITLVNLISFDNQKKPKLNFIKFIILWYKFTHLSANIFKKN